jgi:hypothetical protein
MSLILLLKNHHHWVGWVLKQPFKVHSIVLLLSGVYSLVKTEIVMALFQSVESDVPVKSSERMGL